jgi:hypothetical protein
MKALIMLCVFIFFVLTLNTYADLKDGLVIYFSFDKINGDKVTNEADVKLEGKLEGKAKQAPGFKGMGVALNADVDEATPGNDFVRVGNPPEVNVDKQFTLACWANGTNFGDYRTIMSKTDSGAYALTVEKKLPSGWVHSAGDYLQISGTTELQTNKWYHLALTFDGNDAVIYLDGKEESRKVRKGNITICNADFMIGAEPAGQAVDPSYPAWHGILDEFYFYNRALTKDEIGQLIAQASSVKSRGKLAATWGALKNIGAN